MTVALVLASCAKQGMPSGGPKDETPPQVLRLTPEERTRGFDGSAFEIAFDEYVVLKDAENNILVSPPMRQKPDYKVKGKRLVVQLNDSLTPNTTYLFQFVGAIADFTEGNPLPALEYVFSTGSYIDSMTVRGSVTDALTQEPHKEAVSVWLYTPEEYEQLLLSLSDTAVACPKPRYATRCDKEGAFAFNYISPGAYRCVAVVDEDKSLTVSATETVAFGDSLLTAYGMSDSVAVDSTRRYCEADSHRVQLYYFSPNRAQQRITGSGFKRRGQLTVSTLLPMRDPSVESGGEALVWRLNATRDTMSLWTLREACDSLRLIVSDTTGLHDTLTMKYTPRKMPGGMGLQPPTAMKLNPKKLPYYDTLWLSTSTPFDTARCRCDSAVAVLNAADSSRRYCQVLIDSTWLRAALLFPFRAGGKYVIDVHKNCFYTLYGRALDSLHAEISVTEPEEYGTLNLTVTSAVTEALLVELLTEQGKVLQQRRAAASGPLQFAHLQPGKYRIRAIVDANGNGAWDEGDLGAQRQPERVVYMPKTLEVRANWEYNEELVIRVP